MRVASPLLRMLLDTPHLVDAYRSGLPIDLPAIFGPSHHIRAGTAAFADHPVLHRFFTRTVSHEVRLLGDVPGLLEKLKTA